MPKNIGIMVLGVAVLALGIFIGATVWSPTANAPTPAGQNATNENLPGSSSTANPIKQNTGSVKPTTGSAPAPIPVYSGNQKPTVPHITAPATEARWVIGENHIITWNPAADIQGSIYLVDAASGVTVGWLIQQTNPHDTSYSWNTREVFLSATSPSKKDIAPGRYVVKIKFNSAQFPIIASGPFSIILSSQSQIPTYQFSLKNGTFSPASLSMPRGSKITFMNEDAVTYQMTVSSYGVPFTLLAGGTYIFDTSPLSPGGTYAFYAATSPLTRATVVIQ